MFRGAFFGLMELNSYDFPVTHASEEAMRRQGQREMLETLFDWEPDSVKEERRLREDA